MVDAGQELGLPQRGGRAFGKGKFRQGLVQLVRQPHGLGDADESPAPVRIAGRECQGSGEGLAGLLRPAEIELETAR